MEYLTAEELKDSNTETFAVYLNALCDNNAARGKHFRHAGMTRMALSEAARRARQDSELPRGDGSAGGTEYFTLRDENGDEEVERGKYLRPAELTEQDRYAFVQYLYDLQLEGEATTPPSPWQKFLGHALDECGRRLCATVDAQEDGLGSPDPDRFTLAAKHLRRRSGECYANGWDHKADAMRLAALYLEMPGGGIPVARGETPKPGDFVYTNADGEVTTSPDGDPVGTLTGPGAVERAIMEKVAFVPPTPGGKRFSAPPGGDPPAWAAAAFPEDFTRDEEEWVTIGGSAKALDDAGVSSTVRATPGMLLYRCHSSGTLTTRADGRPVGIIGDPQDPAHVADIVTGLHAEEAGSIDRHRRNGDDLTGPETRIAILESIMTKAGIGFETVQGITGSDEMEDDSTPFD